MHENGMFFFVSGESDTEVNKQVGLVFDDFIILYVVSLCLYMTSITLLCVF